MTPFVLVELPFAEGSRTATLLHMTTIPQRELRNNIGEILRRAEAGEEFTITVSGRPAAQLGPTAAQQWVAGPRLRAIWATPTPETLAQDLERFPGDLVDPFA
jgi:prevent-host-death family protein